MQVLLRNGGKSAAYECKFQNTKAIHYPSGIVKYKLDEDDLISNLRCICNLEYIDIYGDVNCDLLNYYIYFDDNKAYLEVRNKTDSTLVSFNLYLTKSEKQIIKSLTW